MEYMDKKTLIARAVFNPQNSVCTHLKNIETYNDEKKEIKYDVSVDISDEKINLLVMNLSFYNYLLFVTGKLKVNQYDDTLWTSNSAVVFENGINNTDLEFVHNNLLALFDDSTTVKQLIEPIKSLMNVMNSITNIKFEDTISFILPHATECVQSLFKISGLIAHIKNYKPTNNQNKLLIRNIIAYLFCSHQHVQSSVKETFCTFFPSVFDRVWTLTVELEESVINSCSCCGKSKK